MHIESDAAHESQNLSKFRILSQSRPPGVSEAGFFIGKFNCLLPACSNRKPQPRRWKPLRYQYHVANISKSPLIAIIE